MTPPVVVFTALDWEERAVADALGVAGSGPCLLPDGSPAVLQRIGVGLGRAVAAAKSIPSVRCFVVVGCAGALQPDLRTGELLVASAVGLSSPEGQVQPHWPAADSGIAAWAERQGIAVRVGSLLSSAVVVTSVERKRQLAASGALGVDMETAGVMGVALERRVPVTVLRIVLDEAGDALPADLDAVDDTGGVRIGRAMLAALRHPRAMMQLARQRSVCEQRLRAVLPRLLRADALGLPPLDAEQPVAS